MEMSLKIIGVFLIFTLLTSCVAATENKDLPTKEEITGFIAGIPVSDNYINTVVDAVKDKQPAWKCDIWVDKNGNQMLSLYYVDPDSAKGYDSIYFNEVGKEISLCGVEIEPVYQYKGKGVSEENTDNTVEIADETDQAGYKTVEAADETDQTDSETVETADETDQNAEYDERLAEYDERLAEYEKQLAKYEDDQSVDYIINSPKSEYISDKDESQSVEDVTKTVEDVAHTVENVTKTVEDVAQKVRDEEETKRDKKIHDDIFIAVVGTVVGGFVLSKFGWNK